MTSHDDSRGRDRPHAGKHDADCDACPLAVDRRAFLRDAALATAAALIAAGVRPTAAFAESVRTVAPGRAIAGRALPYQIPSADGVSIDADNDVILARWQNRAYAFSLRCTHRGARLQWRGSEGRIFCPKHKARFRLDGAHDSGRTTRALDRYELRREGAALVVRLDALHRVDTDPAGWHGAVVQLE